MRRKIIDDLYPFYGWKLKINSNVDVSPLNNFGFNYTALAAIFLPFLELLHGIF